MPFEIDPNYKEVPQRIADFKAKHPDGCLRPADPARPYWLEQVGQQQFLVYAAAAYRSPDDPTPGIGLAWEPVPGRTTYTRLSELQNAETSAWGRAIVAVLASESKSIASAEDVRNRKADHQSPEGSLAAQETGEGATPLAPSPTIADRADVAADLVKAMFPGTVEITPMDRFNALPSPIKAKAHRSMPENIPFPFPNELAPEDAEQVDRWLALWETKARDAREKAS